jgi:predicted methyltransferase
MNLLMTKNLSLALLTTGALSTIGGCASAPAQPPEAAHAEAAPTPTAPPPPTREEKKKAEAARELAAEREKLDANTAAEKARFTPNLRAEAKELADAKYPTLEAALGAVLKGKHRKPGNAERDKYRHPQETLQLFGLKPNMTVLEYGPGEGWYTEVLAPTLAASGKLIVTTTDPDGPPDARSTFYGEREKRFLDNVPELYGKVERLVIDPKKPQLGMDGKVDMVIVMRGMHGLQRDKLLTGFLAEVYKALKPNGVLGVEQHRGKPDGNPEESAKNGYLPEAFVIKEAEAAGFKLAGKSEINANPKDTKDYPDGV